MSRQPLHDVWEIPDLNKMTSELLDDLVFLATTEVDRTLLLAPDYSEIYRWLHNDHPLDTPLEWSARRILNNQDLTFSILPPWAFEFYNNKEQIISLFKRYASPDGCRKFLDRGVVKDFLLHLEHGTLPVFIHNQPEYWREFTDYLRWFSEEERELMWIQPIRTFNAALTASEDRKPLELPKETRADLAEYYRRLLRELGGIRNDETKRKSNEYDAMSAACAKFINGRFAEDGLSQYLVVFTGSPLPLRTFRRNLIEIDNKKTQFAVSVLSLDCHLRLKNYYSGNIRIASEYGSYADFVQAGKKLFEQVKNVTLPNEVDARSYVSRQYLERVRFDCHFRIPSGILELIEWAQLAKGDKSRISMTDEAEDQANEIQRIVNNERLFRDQMQGVANFLEGTTEEIERHKKETAERMKVLHRQFSVTA
nr:hypothetical protein [Nitrosomonas nitrosa]